MGFCRLDDNTGASAAPAGWTGSVSMLSRHFVSASIRGSEAKVGTLTVEKRLQTTFFFPSLPQKHVFHRTRTHTHMHSLAHSCALLQQRTVALACSPRADSYWKCRAATGASSWRIYMTQVHVLESLYAHTHTHTCKHLLTHAGRRHANAPAHKDQI